MSCLPVWCFCFLLRLPSGPASCVLLPCLVFLTLLLVLLCSLSLPPLYVFLSFVRSVVLSLFRSLWLSLSCLCFCICLLCLGLFSYLCCSVFRYCYFYVMLLFVCGSFFHFVCVRLCFVRPFVLSLVLSSRLSVLRAFVCEILSFSISSFLFVRLSCSVFMHCCLSVVLFSFVN